LVIRLLLPGQVMKLAVSTLVLLACVPSQAEIKHLSRVDEHIYRGRQPDKEGFQELARTGIKTVLDLRGGPIHKPHERKVVEADGMQYISIRLSGIFPPKYDQIASILTVLEDPARWPIFMHCRRGDDRVGLVIACYRMAHDGWTNAEALQDARRQGLNRFELLMRRYIEKFDPARLRQCKVSQEDESTPLAVCPDPALPTSE
jgi:tyrosine-protein phosphatase SIW14